jgi:hypothetical protein
MRKTAFIICSIFVTSILLIAGCGGGTGGQGKADTNAAVRDSIIRALGTDRALNDEALSIFAAMKAGTIPVADGMNKMVGQTSSLLSLIGDMTSRPRPVNPSLSKAEGTAENYLRDRVHQIEGTLNAKSGAEAEAAYAAGQAAVSAELLKVKALLLEYEPSLQKSLP